MRYLKQGKVVVLATSGSAAAALAWTRRLSLGVKERNDGNTPTVSYTRGSDLSGSLEGAGGIGGLLSRSSGYSSGIGNWSVHYCYHADGNGNITYLASPSQTLGASYRYDPYGNTISSSGGLASANTYRFSSKEFHANSGLYYYGERFYSPNLQRWLNWDPMEEAGGINLYGFGGNHSINNIDPFGQQFAPTGPIWSPHHGSVDARSTQLGTINTGNAPVADPPVPSTVRLCSAYPVGSIQNKTDPYTVDTGECPCTGEVTCYDWEHCEVASVAQGLNGTKKAKIWVKHTKCSSCAEYGP